MTAKRFEFREINEPPILPKCYDTEKQEYANLFECVDWLNELNEENEQLKTTIQQLTNDNTKQKKKLNTTMKENEQLRQELHIYHKLASCSNCNYHDYDWYDDGDEFEVCRKGNDVTERICKDWREL